MTDAPVIRAEDQRVAEIAFQLATKGVARCPRPAPSLGLVWQHLTQFQLHDRPTAALDYGLDRGPGVLAVVDGGPASRADVRPGDVLLAINGSPVAPDDGALLPFDQTRARARADAIDAQLEAASTRGPVTLTLARGAEQVGATLSPTTACPSRVHLARSRQLNAFADGTHVYLTTRLLDRAGSDGALAFVIAHEMAHNILEHANRLRQSGRTGVLGRSALVRQTEREADRLGVDLLLDAGYDVDAASTLLDAVDTGLPQLAFLSAHDDLATRKRALAAEAAAWAAARGSP